jgi:hypothetical protein
VSAQPMIVAADSLDAEDQELSNGGRKTYGGFKSRSRRILVSFMYPRIGVAFG